MGASGSSSDSSPLPCPFAEHLPSSLDTSNSTSSCCNCRSLSLSPSPASWSSPPSFRPSCTSFTAPLFSPSATKKQLHSSNQLLGHRVQGYICPTSTPESLRGRIERSVFDRVRDPRTPLVSAAPSGPLSDRLLGPFSFPGVCFGKRPGREWAGCCFDLVAGVGVGGGEGDGARATLSPSPSPQPPVAPPPNINSPTTDNAGRT